MKRSLACVVLLVALGACDEGDDDGVAQNRKPEPDSGVLEVRVSNAGEPCSLFGRDCQGSHAQCLEISFSGAYYANGYCTADCKQTAECGLGAECPVSEAERESPSYRFRSTWARKCFKSCSPSSTTDCRPGYACRTMAEAYAASDAPAPMQRFVCLPRAIALTRDGGALRHEEHDED